MPELVPELMPELMPELVPELMPEQSGGIPKKMHAASACIAVLTVLIFMLAYKQSGSQPCSGFFRIFCLM